MPQIEARSGCVDRSAPKLSFYVAHLNLGCGVICCGNARAFGFSLFCCLPSILFNIGKLLAFEVELPQLFKIKFTCLKFTLIAVLTAVGNAWSICSLTTNLTTCFMEEL
ncbi:Protein DETOXIFICATION [Trichinella spiralis]|uniref:Protein DETOXIFICATION n=1 Tax=Trichinella spiralis TaxID=6334 RepID=A0ABR3KTW9_TRISP